MRGKNLSNKLTQRRLLQQTYLKRETPCSRETLNTQRYEETKITIKELIKLTHQLIKFPRTIRKTSINNRHLIRT